MGTTDRVLAGSKTKGSSATHTSSIRPFLQGINAASDEDYFATALVPRVGAGPRFALFRGNNRISPLNFDDTIRTADMPVRPKVSHYTASITFTGVPQQSTQTLFRGFRIFAADGSSGLIIPDSVNRSIPLEYAPKQWLTTFAVTGSADDCIKQLGKQINKLFAGKILATSGSDRPLTLNRTLFLKQTAGGPLGKQIISIDNMTETSINGSIAHSYNPLTASLYTSSSLFGAAQELDVSFLGKNPVRQRINFQREEVNFGQPPTSPEKQPFHAVNNFNPVSFIEADERSMWPVNLFNAGNLPHRVFDGVIEPLDIRSVLLQMHDPRYDGHGVQAELQGASAAGILGSKEIQDSRINGDPASTPFLDSPVSFNAGAQDIAAGVNFTGKIAGQSITLAGVQNKKHALQPYSNIDIQQSNPFFERSAQELIADIQNFNNPIEISRTKPKNGYKSYVRMDFVDSIFKESTSLDFSSANSCNLVLTSSDGTMRTYTGSITALTSQFPPSGNGIVPFFVDIPTPSFMLISQGTTVPVSANTATDYSRIRLVMSPMSASDGVTWPVGAGARYGNLNNPRIVEKRIAFFSTATPSDFFPENGYGAGTSFYGSDMGVTTPIPTNGITTPEQATRSIIDAINNPLRKINFGSAYAEAFSTGSFTGIKITHGVPGDVQNNFVNTHFGSSPLNGTDGWQLTDSEPAGWRPESSGSGGFGNRSWAFIEFDDSSPPQSGDTLTIITPPTRADIKNPLLYNSSSTFTFDSSVTTFQSGLGVNKYIIGLNSSSLIGGAGPQDNATLSAIATTLSIYNTIGNPISGTVGVIHGGDYLFLSQLWHLPQGNTQATATYNDDNARNWSVSGFHCGDKSLQTRKNSQRALIAAITGAYGNGSNVTITRKNTVTFPEPTITLTQNSSNTKQVLNSATVISSSIRGTRISPGAGPTPVDAGRQYGEFAGPPQTKAPDITRELGKMDFNDMGDLDIRRQNSNRGFYFDKKAGSIAYGDES